MEKEIIIEDNETIENAVEMLLEEKRKGNHVFCNFNDVILHSDNVTLDSAYRSICGCSKEEHLKKLSSILISLKKF